jgi:DNA-binding transcriptional LysR family regulator
MDRLTSIEVFAKVVANRSFAGAARQANLSSTAVSRHVQELESWLGARLLNRSTRTLSLTESGEAFHARCTRILSEIDDAKDFAGALQTNLRGRLRVSAPGALGIQHVTPAIVDFMASNPHVSVHLDLNDRHVDVLGEGYDLALIVGDSPDAALTARRLASVHFVTCAAPDYLRRRGAPRTPDDLRNHDCLQYSGFLWPQKAWRFTARNGDAVVVELSPRFVSATAALLKAVLKGAGVLQCPSYAIADELKSGSLVPVLTEYRVPELAVFALHAQGRQVSTKLRNFIDLLASRFGPEAARGA